MYKTDRLWVANLLSKNGIFHCIKEELLFYTESSPVDITGISFPDANHSETSTWAVLLPSKHGDQKSHLSLKIKNFFYMKWPSPLPHPFLTQRLTL